MPLLHRLPPLGFTLAALLLAPAAGADTGLANLPPAGALLVVQVRNLPELRAAWGRTPYARTWADPAVQKFFAPGIAKFEEQASKFSEQLQKDDGITPGELLDLFPGGALVAVDNIDPAKVSEPGFVPPLLFAAEVGPNRAKLETLFHKGAETGKEHETTEEFQGVTLHTVLPEAAEGKKPGPTFTWTFAGDTVLVGTDKALVQQAVANRGRGADADSVARQADFAALGRLRPDNSVVGYVNLERLVASLVGVAKAREAATAAAQGHAAANPMGITPAGIVHALGFDALRSVAFAATLDRDASTLDFNLRWNERRGLLRALAYGAPPAPQPAFVSDSWLSVSSVRFSVKDAYAAIRETLRTGLPAVDGMVQQQILNLNQKLGIDLERDLFGSLGDEVTNAIAAGTAPGGADGSTAFRSTDRLIAFSLTDADALRRLVDRLKAENPQSAKLFVPRDYLGETLYTFTPPPPPPGTRPSQAFAYAITRTHLFICLGSASMLETALQCAAGNGKTIWRRADVATALAELPPGGVSVEFEDMRRLVPLLFEGLASLPGTRPGTPRPPAQPGGADRPTAGHEAASSLPWDPSAKPDAAAIERYWSTAAGAVYPEADGLHGVCRIKQVE